MQCVAGSSPDKITDFLFSIDFISPAALTPGFTQPVTEMSIRNKKEKFLGSRARLARKADKLTTICKPILNISQSYSPPRPVTRIALHYGDGVCFL
jgi:hypothetical protein